MTSYDKAINSALSLLTHGPSDGSPAPVPDRNAATLANIRRTRELLDRHDTIRQTPQSAKSAASGHFAAAREALTSSAHGKIMDDLAEIQQRLGRFAGVTKLGKIEINYDDAQTTIAEGVSALNQMASMDGATWAQLPDDMRSEALRNIAMMLSELGLAFAAIRKHGVQR